MQLPVNAVIIVSIAVLVLAATAAFFSGQIYTGLNAIEAEQLYAQACNALRANCDADLDAVAAGGYSLAEICLAKGLAYSDQCLQGCGCTASYSYPLATEKDRTTVTSNIFENVGVVTPT